MISSIYSKLIMGLTALACAVLAFAMLVTTADVIMRYFLHNPITGVYEIIELLMGVLSPLAILYCSWRKDHVSVGLVFNMLPRSPRRIVNVISHICVLLVFCILSWQGWLLIEEVMASNLATPTLDLPMWPAACCIWLGFTLIIPIGCIELWRAARGEDTQEHHSAPEEAGI